MAVNCDQVECDMFIFLLYVVNVVGYICSMCGRKMERSTTWGTIQLAKVVGAKVGPRLPTTDNYRVEHTEESFISLSQTSLSEFSRLSAPE